jgi:ferredoxin-NADP reductase
VAIEGPYGTFTADRTERDRVLLVGAGVGTAPVLALLQELPAATDVTVLLRASTRADLVLRDEVAAEVARRDGRLVELVGSRDEVAVGAAALRRIVPDLGRRDVFLCGPDALSRHIASEVERAGVPERRIHFESFTF